MTCGHCGASLFAVQVTAMLGVNGGQVQPASGRLVCGSCSKPLEGFQLVTVGGTNVSGLVAWQPFTPHPEGDGHP